MGLYFATVCFLGGWENLHGASCDVMRRTSSALGISVSLRMVDCCKNFAWLFVGLLYLDSNGIMDWKENESKVNICISSPLLFIRMENWSSP